MQKILNLFVVPRFHPQTDLHGSELNKMAHYYSCAIIALLVLVLHLSSLLLADVQFRTPDASLPSRIQHTPRTTARCLHVDHLADVGHRIRLLPRSKAHTDRGGALASIPITG
jgi:hypothetical protein